MPVENVADFFKKDVEQNREKVNLEIKKWEKNVTREEKQVLDKFNRLDGKLEINQYVNNIKFVTDVVLEREETEAIELAQEKISKPLTEIEKLRASIDRNKLEHSVEGFCNIGPAELGIYSELRNEKFEISEEKFLEIKNHVLNKTFKHYGFLEVSLNPERTHQEIPLLVKATLKRGEKAVFLTDKDNKLTSLVLKDGMSLKPQEISIRNLLGKQYLVVKADLVKENDFENSKSITWGRRNYENFSELLSPTQREALDLYMRREYQNINSYLRTGVLPEGQEKDILESRIEKISSALAIKPIPEPVILYRRVGQEVFGFGSVRDSPIVTFDKPKPFSKEVAITVDEFRSQWINKDIQDKAFISTSLSSADIPSFQGGRFIFRINADKGTRAAYVSGLGGFEGENEVILDKGTTFRVNRISSFEELMANRTKITKVIIDVTAVQ